MAMLTASGASGQQIRNVKSFDEDSALEQWISVNDNVMGGVSRGSIRITDQGTLAFSGDISLENRGGFASIRTRPERLQLEGYDTIALRVKGDGRGYTFNLRTASTPAAASYSIPIQTQKETWKEFRLPLDEFVYTAFGRRIKGIKALSGGDIQSVGFTLADKKAGPFLMEVDWIRAEKAGAAIDKEPANPTDATGRETTIVETALTDGRFSQLVAALKAAGLVETLQGEGPFTVFAPSDAAFARLPEGVLEDLLRPEQRDRLVAVLTYHVVQGTIRLEPRSVKTIQGQALTIQSPGTFEVNGAKVVAANVEASNGVIHIIDRVLLPPEANMTPRQSAAALIELAIERGVPLFNADQGPACVAVYEVAAQSLLALNTNALNAADRLALREALDRMRKEDDDPRAQAWTLRRALDAVYLSLTGPQSEGQQ